MLLLEESWKFCQYQISLSSTGPGASCSFHIVGIHSPRAQPVAGGLYLFIVLADLFLIIEIQGASPGAEAAVRYSSRNHFSQRGHCYLLMSQWSPRTVLIKLCEAALPVCVSHTPAACFASHSICSSLINSFFPLLGFHFTSPPEISEPKES